MLSDYSEAYIISVISLMVASEQDLFQVLMLLPLLFPLPGGYSHHSILSLEKLKF